MDGSWPYMFTVVITGSDKEKVKEATETLHRLTEGLWRNLPESLKKDATFESSPVDLM